VNDSVLPGVWENIHSIRLTGLVESLNYNVDPARHALLQRGLKTDSAALAVISEKPGISPMEIRRIPWMEVLESRRELEKAEREEPGRGQICRLESNRTKGPLPHSYGRPSMTPAGD